MFDRFRKKEVSHEYTVGEKASEALEDAARTKPRTKSFGFFSHEEWAPDERGCFMWFDSLEEMYQFMVRFLPYSPEGIAPLGFPEANEALKKVLTPLPKELNDSIAERINKALDGIEFIIWMGDFQDLCTSKSQFQSNLRQDFLNYSGAPPVPPIPKHLYEDFIHFITYV